MSLDAQSAHFHAFEWLRAEALKGNKHAMALITRIGNLEQEWQQISSLFGAHQCTLYEAISGVVKGQSELRTQVVALQAHLRDIALNLCGVDLEKEGLGYDLVYAFVEGQIDLQYDLRSKAQEREKTLFEMLGRMKLLVETIGTTNVNNYNVCKNATQVLEDYRKLTLPKAAPNTLANDGHPKAQSSPPEHP